MSNQTFNQPPQLVDVDRARELLGRIVSVYRAPNRQTAEMTVLKILSDAGFTSPRLYYLTDAGRLVGARIINIDSSIVENFSNGKIMLPPPEADTSGTKASYYTIQKQEPIIVHVDPTRSENLAPACDSAGIPSLEIREAPLRKELQRPAKYQWLDIPLLDDKARAFGKISLDKEGGTARITAEDYNLVRLLLHPISDAIIACGWFAGSNLPESFVEKFWEGAATKNTLDELITFAINHVRQTFNASQCSLFWVHKSHVPQKVNCSQPEKLVLWGTTFDDLQNKCYRDYYKKGQGLTGHVWQDKETVYVPDLKEDKRWNKGHLNDSDTHVSYIGVPILAGDGEVSGVLRVPEGKSHRLLHVDADMLTQFCRSILGPAIRHHIRSDRLEHLDHLVDDFKRHMNSLDFDSQELPDAQVWDYAVKACEKLFGCQDKKIIAYSIMNQSYCIEKSKGDLPFLSHYQEGSLFDQSTSSAAAKVFEAREPILLTDIEQAKQDRAYLSVVDKVQCALVLPLQGVDGPFGLIAVTSSLYDILKERDLPLLSLVGKHCEALRSLEHILRATRQAERKRMLHVLAYSAKVPARRFRTYATKVMESINNDQLPSASDLSDLITTARWVLIAVDSIHYSVEGVNPFLLTSSISLEQFISQAEKILTAWLKFHDNKDLELEFDHQVHNNQELEVDCESLYTALSCIFDNAMKVAPEESQITVSFQTTQDQLHISVRDNGTGIPEDIQRQVFEPGFHREFEIGRGVPKGAGYGLTVANVFTKAHSGEIIFEKHRGKYCVVKIVLPLRNIPKGE